MSKRCFTIVHCSLHSRCALAHQPHTNGYFHPHSVGEHCHQFQQMVFEKSDDDISERITELLAKAGAHA